MAATADPEAWLDSHGDALYAFAMMRVRNAAVAEDLVQETLLAALGALAGFDGRSSERTWLIGILKHKLIDHLRRAGREQTADTTSDDEAVWNARFDHTGHWAEPPRDWGDPARIAENDGLRQALAGCIARLPERQRLLFVLREVDGLDTDELLDTLGISSANNLWVMLSRARAALRECIERTWGGGGRR
ncbi:MAG: sigma-70 family RNA polymerase sigma factor [Gammaproteobacteria bacterium]|nr:sigma-70 family RNA polymerase sigma factor [Gammaproteobacteria bacterium]MCP5199732.1 sigma-70 family RNA polymerase sigma factor [Gammaproteobacteria bacterium]